jgi:tetratricopeptide (TPR) repeat protein
MILYTPVMKNIYLTLIFVIISISAAAQSFDDYMNLAQIKADTWDYDEAIEAYDKALELQAGDANFYYLRAYAKDMDGQREDAIDDYSKSIELNPNNPEIYYARGYAREYVYDYQGAVEDFSKYLDMEGDDADIYSIRAS